MESLGKTKRMYNQILYFFTLYKYKLTKFLSGSNI